MDLEAFIFDFDNTVVYSNEDHVKSFLVTAEKFGYKITPDQVRRRFGMSAFEILADLFPHLSKKQIEKIRREKEKEYRRVVSRKKVRTIGGARDLLKFLKKEKIKTGIVSSASVRNIQVCLKKNRLGKYFRVKVGAESVKKHKPNPEPLLKAMKKLNVKPKNCIYIGDSIYDMMAAKRAGIKTRYGLATGFYSKRQLKAKGATKTFKNHTEVLRTLRSGRT